MRNTVRFNSPLFNTTEPKDYFVDPGAFGDDVGNWLRPRLEALGYRVAGPAQEDWGWSLECTKDGAIHSLNIAYLGDCKDGSWEIFIARVRTLGDRLLGRNRAIDPELARAIHAILTASAEIRVMSWVNLDLPFGESDRAGEP